MLYRDYRPEDRQAIGAVHDAARKTELRLAGLEEAFLPLEIAGEMRIPACSWRRTGAG